MREVAGATALLGVVFIIAGLPSAILLRNRTEGWLAASVDAAIHGLVWLPLAVTAWTWLGPWGLGVVLGTWAAAVAAVVYRRSWPAVRRLRASRGEVAYGAGWLVVLTVTTLIRLREVNFLPWLGDMGAYVNWANEFVRTGEMDNIWPPFFPAYLSISTWAFGPEHTTIGMAATGIILVLAIARLLTALHADRWLVLTAAAVLAVSVPAVWYSSFPGSESLNAPIFILWLTLILRVLRAGGGPDRATVAAVGITMLALGLLRGSGGLLLVPLAAALVLMLAVRVWRPLAARLWPALAASAVAAIVAYWYGISEIREYFVDVQLKVMIPGGLWQGVNDLGLFDPTRTTGAVLVVSVALGVVLGSAVVRWITAAVIPGERDTSWPAAIVLLGVAGLFMAFLVVQAQAGGEFWAILQRMGWWLAVGTVVGLVAAAMIRRRAEQAVVLLGGLTVLMFVVLHADRLGPTRDHSFYLYWDRYLVSEVLPMFVVLTFFGLSVLVQGVVGWLNRARGRAIQAELAAFAVGTFVLVLVVPPTLSTLRLTTDDVYMRGAYDLVSELDELAGDPTTPVFWSADSESGLPGYFFPNTWMAFALPLEASFGYDVVNVHRGEGYDFGRDDVIDAGNVAQLASCAETDVVVVLDLATGGAPLDERLEGSGAIVNKLGRAEEPVLFLKQPAGETGWFALDFSVTGWRVDLRELVAEPEFCEL